MKRILVGMAVLVFARTPAQSDTVVYSNDFESSAGPEWSIPSIDTAPAGESFLGRFLNDTTLTLTLADLPDHTSATISFDLYVIHSWDGSVYGPDLWSFAVTNGPTLLHSSFANPLNGTADNPQAYPGTYPQDLYPAQSGATAVNSLGYWNVAPVNFGDAVYRLEYTFPHADDDIQFVFAAAGFTGDPLPYGLGDESWGLDNVAISVVPEPASTCGMFLSTTIALMASRRRDKR